MECGNLVIVILLLPNVYCKLEILDKWGRL